MSFRILVVDDEELILRTIKKVLSKEGYEVTVVNRPDDAIEVVKKANFDLIISDIRMPERYGVKMVEEIRALLESKGRKRIPEIFMTGYASDESLKEAERLGVAEYIYKPFDVREFLKLVNRQLKK